MVARQARTLTPEQISSLGYEESKKFFGALGRPPAIEDVNKLLEGTFFSPKWKKTLPKDLDTLGKFLEGVLKCLAEYRAAQPVSSRLKLSILELYVKNMPAGFGFLSAELRCPVSDVYPKLREMGTEEAKALVPKAEKASRANMAILIGVLAILVVAGVYLYASSRGVEPPPSRPAPAQPRIKPPEAPASVDASQLEALYQKICKARSPQELAKALEECWAAYGKPSPLSSMKLEDAVKQSLLLIGAYRASEMNAKPGLFTDDLLDRYSDLPKALEKILLLYDLKDLDANSQEIVKSLRYSLCMMLVLKVPVPLRNDMGDFIRDEKGNLRFVKPGEPYYLGSLYYFLANDVYGNVEIHYPNEPQDMGLPAVPEPY